MPEDVKQLKVWIVTEQVGMTSSLMSCKGLEFMLFQGLLISGRPEMTGSLCVDAVAPKIST